MIVLASIRARSERLPDLNTWSRHFSPHTKAAPIWMRLDRYPCLLFTSASIGAFPTRNLDFDWTTGTIYGGVFWVLSRKSQEESTIKTEPPHCQQNWQSKSFSLTHFSIS